MKIFFIILFLSVTLILLPACGLGSSNPGNGEPANAASNRINEIEDKVTNTPLEGKFRSEYLGDGVRGWILYDEETGCEYIAVSGSGSYTPRLNSHGAPMCKDSQ